MLEARCKMQGLRAKASPTEGPAGGFAEDRELLKARNYKPESLTGGAAKLLQRRIRTLVGVTPT